MKIHIFEHTEIHPDALSLLRDSGHELSLEGVDQPPEGTVAVMFRTYTNASKEFLDRFPKLRFVIRAGVGLDNIDIQECKKRGIEIVSSPGSNANAVSDLVVLYMLMLLRNLTQQMKSLEGCTWRDKTYMGQELKGKIIGLVGAGAIGQLVAKKAEGFGISEVIGYDPFLSVEVMSDRGIRKVELDTVFTLSDIVSLHVPLLPETQNLVDVKRLQSMKPSAYIINTSRGGIVDEDALIKALKDKSIAGAALDVFEHEPEVRKELLALDTVIATPHIGAYTVEADRAMSVQAVQRFLEATSSRIQK